MTPFQSHAWLTRGWCWAGPGASFPRAAYARWVVVRQAALGLVKRRAPRVKELVARGKRPRS